MSFILSSYFVTGFANPDKDSFSKKIYSNIKIKKLSCIPFKQYYYSFVAIKPLPPPLSSSHTLLRIWWKGLLFSQRLHSIPDLGTLIFTVRSFRVYVNSLGSVRLVWPTLDEQKVFMTPVTLNLCNLNNLIDLICY